MVDYARREMAKQKREYTYQSLVRVEHYVPTTGNKYPVPHYSTREVMRGRHRVSSAANKRAFKEWQKTLPVERLGREMAPFIDAAVWVQNLRSTPVGDWKPFD